MRPAAPAAAHVSRKKRRTGRQQLCWGCRYSEVQSLIDRTRQSFGLELDEHSFAAAATALRRSNQGSLVALAEAQRLWREVLQAGKLNSRSHSLAFADICQALLCLPARLAQSEALQACSRLLFVACVDKLHPIGD